MVRPGGKNEKEKKTKEKKKFGSQQDVLDVPMGIVQGIAGLLTFFTILYGA